LITLREAESEMFVLKIGLNLDTIKGKVVIDTRGVLR
jgi:hypothetical protein